MEEGDNIQSNVTGVALVHLEYYSKRVESLRFRENKTLRVKWETSLQVYSGPFDPYQYCQCHDYETSVFKL